MQNTCSQIDRCLLSSLAGMVKGESLVRGLLTTPSWRGLQEMVLFSWCIKEEVNGVQMKFIDVKMRGGVLITQVQEITCRLSISRSVFALFTCLVNTKLDLILEYKMDAK